MTDSALGRDLGDAQSLAGLPTALLSAPASTSEAPPLAGRHHELASPSPASGSVA
jgi:hypothetical protein